MSNKKTSLALLGMLSVLGFCASAFADDDGGVLAGRVVRSRDSQPIADARVEIRETGAKTTTDAQGAYSFGDLTPGTYTLVVTPSSGAPIERKATVAGNKTTREDITVSPEKSALLTEMILSRGSTFKNIFVLGWYRRRVARQPEHNLNGARQRDDRHAFAFVVETTRLLMPQSPKRAFAPTDFRTVTFL